MGRVPVVVPSPPLPEPVHEVAQAYVRAPGTAHALRGGQVTADGPDAFVLGVDSGGSGLRVALGSAGTGGQVFTAACAEPVRTGPSGIDAAHLLAQVLPVARDLLARAAPGATVTAAAVGAAGMATLGDQLRASLPAALADALGVRRVALAADAVTAYAGALGQRPGAVVAGGTGMIALGTDLTVWRRADGWGHLLGDSGGGAWIGRAGLDAAMRAHDGRRGGSAALLARLEAVFGPAAGLPGLLYPRTDRPALLASFAPEVAACATGDEVAAGILRTAAAHIAEAAAAACPPPRAASGRSEGDDGEPCEVALTGGLFKMGDPLLGPLRAELARQVPQARVVRASGDPLAGALEIGRALARSELRLPPHPTLLFLPDAA
ncbi:MULTISPECIES: BadF/BadG/BcrA/BcrD ATPase family protein [unclassified Streptomyces]|uniref:N-acetylglucosamine kinase n=1 Tax=unclassified Streptomyces TaxID=2593676 RepID=UPI0001C1B0CC|nr:MULTISPECIES: BadF/BadG/BcrA/BcrD ATPase family protein [unclassified Streptomyces]AEN08480.1 ATPase BadF/BadG/BcrA/BcrD type [Streptomyces sp. SirexAA-E]MYS03360.1 ATPase [Streptomyces sp. SID4940]MYT66374.1 ATPase [Streptomyces sp. SID8357]MYT83295.1 ATPase [Streptomyces sp. SID8360]MYU34009.1 ATPase [Streptomyces sp. SID8358]